MTLKDAWRGFWKKPMPPGHEFTEEDRALSREVRQIRAQALVEREQANLIRAIGERMRAEDLAGLGENEDVDEDSDDDQLDALFSKIERFKQMTATTTSKTQGQIEFVSKRLTDDELRSYKSKIPKLYLKRAKTMTDSQLMDLIASHKPEFLTEYDQDTIRRALKILKE